MKWRYWTPTGQREPIDQPSSNLNAIEGVPASGSKSQNFCTFPKMELTKPTKPNSVSFVSSVLAKIQNFPDGVDGLDRGAGEGDLVKILRGHALELWSETAGGRLFIVADEADAARLQERRGETLTVSELEFVARIEDPALVAEVLRYKREFNGVLRPNTTP
jgi:hypothetical protein